MYILGLGRYSQYRYSIDTDINRYVSIPPSCCTDTDGDSCKNNEYSGPKTIHWSWVQVNIIFIQFNKKLKSILSLILICWTFNLCFRTSICRIHCIDQSKIFTLLLKSKILDCETLSCVHVYRIEYVSYRQGPYRIHIDTADDRIVPALVCT